MKKILIIDELDFIYPQQAKQDVNNAILFTGKTLFVTALDYDVVIVNGKLIKNRFGDLDMPIPQLFEVTVPTQEQAKLLSIHRDYINQLQN